MATQKEIMQATHDKVTELKTILVGLNGDEGLIGEVKAINKRLDVSNGKLYDHEGEIERLKGKLSTWKIVLICILGASGSSGGIYALLQRLGG